MRRRASSHLQQLQEKEGPMSREGLQKLQRSVRHAAGYFTPQKQQQQQEEGKMQPEDGILLLRTLGTKRAYERVKHALIMIDKRFDVLPATNKVSETIIKTKKFYRM